MVDQNRQGRLTKRPVGEVELRDLSLSVQPKLRHAYMFRNILMKRVTIKGIVIIDYFSRMSKFLNRLSRGIQTGQVKWRVEFVQGLENAPCGTSETVHLWQYG